MPSYIHKTLQYLKRNGIKSTYYAVMERLAPGGMADYNGYTYIPPRREELDAQRLSWRGEEAPFLFSLLVPAYETKPEYLCALIDSVQAQTWESWELVLVDAGKSDVVEKTASLYGEDARIRYYRLHQNGGISVNTNQALEKALGRYVGLLDHDDLLTPDALYEMAAAIKEKEGRGTGGPLLLYSDEDKCDGTGNYFYEPHIKEKFNLDLFFTNNYICHFMLLEREMFQKLRMRSAYDGAQDYDLALRVIRALLEKGRMPEEWVLHVPKVLYHWRCHTQSTAENPGSKLYAYEAGRRAVQDFLSESGIDADVENTTHVGFYRVDYRERIWGERPDIRIIGGKIVGAGNKILSGILTEDGHPLYAGLDVHYSGYLHRAALQQDAAAVDVRCMRLRMELVPLFEKYFGTAVPDELRTGAFFSTQDLWRRLHIPGDTEEEWHKVSLRFCELVRGQSPVCRILWDPSWTVKL